MARSTHRSRPIVVEGVAYRWRLVTGESASELRIVAALPGHGALLVALPGWRDQWLTLSPVPNDPAVITNAFVRAAVLAGRTHGYDPTQRGGRWTLTYQAGAFTAPPR